MVDAKISAQIPAQVLYDIIKEITRIQLKLEDIQDLLAILNYDNFDKQKLSKIYLELANIDSYTKTILEGLEVEGDKLLSQWDKLIKRLEES